MSKVFSMTLLLLIPILVGAALEDAQSYYRAIDDAMLIHYSGMTSEAERAVSRLNKLAETLESFTEDSDDIEVLKIRTALYLYRGLLLIDLGQEDEASGILAEGIEFCDDQYEQKVNQYFLIQGAVLRSQWMLLQKTSVLIRTGKEIRNMTDLALEADPQDLTARLLDAQGLINAPPLFGGDPVEAARILKESVALSKSDYDLFSLYLSLADALRKKKNWDQASQWCEKALSLYPNNRKALEMQDLISNRKK